jgi:formylglycine-generating enzyme required for sulfatase activity
MLISEPYVFISYARADQTVAQKVHDFLTEAGLRVFWDKSHIAAGANWDLSIEQALEKCERMVLLLSPASMESKEVYNEWFPFDQKGKTIYPLYLRDCELHRRLIAIHYIDARADLRLALGQLLDQLRLPDAKTGAKPDALSVFRRERIAEWSKPRHDLDKRFVNLTLLVDQGPDDPQRWRRAEDSRFHDLRDALAKTTNDPALVLLGAPGSGKSTLLRRLQLDHSQDHLADGADEISFFIQLNEYHGDEAPREWLLARWRERHSQLAPLDDWLKAGRALLLLDALNEMQPRGGATYASLIAGWKEFLRDAARDGNRILFSCRSLDYSAPLSSKELPVPQIEIQPMNAEQVRDFLRAYAPAQEQRIWDDIDGTPQFTLFQTPYFLKLLCEQVEADGELPRGRAGLFTGFVRKALARESDGALFQAGALLTERDQRKLTQGEWADAFDLPRGPLIPSLSGLAFSMQENGMKSEGAQVRLPYDEARDLIAHERAEDILKAGCALNVLDEYVGQEQIAFFHQLLQEYFAARQLAREPKPALVHVEWEAANVSPALAETLGKLADDDPLPPLPQTGWEETAVTAAPMAKEQAAFIRGLVPHNLPLAARCAASPEVKIGDELKREIQKALIERTQDKRADLRARIAAGEALGTLGDPRFERRTGPHGDYLLPPLVAITGGTYPMGLDKSDYDDETPAHKVELAPFQIGQFPVTNAEYKLFIEAGGYDDPQWWDTEESLAWLRGEASMEGVKQGLRDFRTRRQEESEDDIRGRVKKNLITSEEAENWIAIRNMTDEEFEQQLEKWYPAGKLYRQPEYWDDTRFNNPAQPVVGITWFEARAFCNWLTASVAEDVIYRLPTEAEFEAAARGAKGRMFPYGKTFDSARCNTFESHIRRTTPKPGEQIKGSGQNDHFIGHFEILSLCKSD